MASQSQSKRRRQQQQGNNNKQAVIVTTACLLWLLVFVSCWTWLLDKDKEAQVRVLLQTQQHQQTNDNTNDHDVFTLFADFDLSPHILGNETWFDLVRYRRDAQAPTLPFYVDKVASRRWFAQRNIPTPTAFAVKYQSELVQQAQDDTVVQDTILKLLPTHADFAAKPTHLSCSGGVWITKRQQTQQQGKDSNTNNKNNTTYSISNGKTKFHPVSADFGLDQIAASLTQSLKTIQTLCAGKVPESWALQNVKPGILIDERFTSWNIDTDNNIAGDDDSDDRGGMEFKVFTLWGKAWMIVHRPGHDKIGGFFHPNGTAIAWKNTPNNKKKIKHRDDNEQSIILPDWLDWNQMVALAERLGAHKDMFRTDIFVGIPAGKRRPGLPLSWSDIQMVVSETEIHPTPYGPETNHVFEEGARLWKQGYADKNKYRVVPNTQVPVSFVATGQYAVVDGSNV